MCATRSPGQAVKLPLTPIPVAGPFDRIGVNVIQFPRSQDGNQYAVDFCRLFNQVAGSVCSDRPVRCHNCQVACGGDRQ